MRSDRSRLTVRLLALAAALGLLFAGCGDDSGGGGEADATADASGDAGCASDVCMEGIAYSETDITVAVGDTVTWTNLDGVPHTVTAGTPSGPVPEQFDSGNIEGGESFDQTFAAAGEFNYFCTIHPQMEAAVTVQ